MPTPRTHRIGSLDLIDYGRPTPSAFRMDVAPDRLVALTDGHVPEAVPRRVRRAARRALAAGVPRPCLRLAPPTLVGDPWTVDAVDAPQLERIAEGHPDVTLPVRIECADGGMAAVLRDWQVAALWDLIARPGPEGLRWTWLHPERVVIEDRVFRARPDPLVP